MLDQPWSTLLLNKLGNLELGMLQNENIHILFLTGWKELTSGGFSLQFLPGGHFFLKDKPNTDHILSAISKSLV